jgi:hypothetical protein
MQLGDFSGGFPTRQAAKPGHQPAMAQMASKSRLNALKPPMLRLALAFIRIFHFQEYKNQLFHLGLA